LKSSLFEFISLGYERLQHPPYRSACCRTRSFFSERQSEEEEEKKKNTTGSNFFVFAESWNPKNKKGCGKQTTTLNGGLVSEAERYSSK